MEAAGGQVRELSDDEGGELVRYQIDQLRLFVAELIEVREARGVTKASLAWMTGLRSNPISDLEAGRTPPDWSTISRIAFTLDADIHVGAVSQGSSCRCLMVDRLPSRADLAGRPHGPRSRLRLQDVHR